MDERIPGLLERPEMCASFVTPDLIYYIYKYIDNINLLRSRWLFRLFSTLEGLIKGDEKGEKEEYKIKIFNTHSHVYIVYLSKDKAALIIN